MKLSTNKNISHNFLENREQGTEYRKRIKFFCFLFSVFCSLFLLGMSSKPMPAVYIKKLKDSRYQLIVSRKPYIIKGVCYNPIPIGKNYEYDWWLAPNKPWIADGKLMKEMGINTIRVYKTGANPEAVQQVVHDLYELYGIRTILGSWLGFWEYPCPSYADKNFQERVKDEVLEMVRLYKNEPGVLMWILGNENNYSFSGQINPWSSEEIDKLAGPIKQKQARAEIYYSFVHELVREIHKLDFNHPVALGNGELIGLDIAAKACPDIDLVTCIIYRGKTFGNLFNSLKMTFDKPLLISEFGADAYDAFLNKEDQNTQAFFLESQWRQIYDNLVSNKKGAGNCIGGIMFEWSDEWWKHNENDPQGWLVHDTDSNWSNSSYYVDIKAKGNKNMNEEWFGIVAVSEDINTRLPRKSYYVTKEFWKNPSRKKEKEIFK